MDRHELDQGTSYVSFLIVADAGFKYHYSAYENSAIRCTLRQRVELLKQLAQSEQIEILSTDDEIDPFSWVLIEPNGYASTIQTKLTDEYNIEDFYNFPFGNFRTSKPVIDEELQILIELIKPVYPDISIWHGVDGPVINGDFNKVKSSFKKLRNLDHHYEIQPNGKNKWFDKTEKSSLFISVMKDFRRHLKQDLCIFPRNYAEVKNIEGGSDSEEHCILLTDSGEEKIIYKVRRKSWKK